MLVHPHLSLLANDGDSILQFDIMEKALEKNVGHSDQVVVLLRLVERVAVLVVCLVTLKEQRGLSKAANVNSFPAISLREMSS